MEHVGWVRELPIIGTIRLNDMIVPFAVRKPLVDNLNASNSLFDRR